MNSLEAIHAAIADGATPEQKALGAAACRAILAALEAEPGKPIAMPGAPAPHPLAGIDPGQALDLLIARLTAALPKEDAKTTAAPAAPDPRGLRIAFVAPTRRPAAPAAARPGRTPTRRKP